MLEITREKNFSLTPGNEERELGLVSYAFFSFLKLSTWKDVKSLVPAPYAPPSLRPQV